MNPPAPQPCGWTLEAKAGIVRALGGVAGDVALLQVGHSSLYCSVRISSDVVCRR